MSASLIFLSCMRARVSSETDRTYKKLGCKPKKKLDGRLKIFQFQFSFQLLMLRNLNN